MTAAMMTRLALIVLIGFGTAHAGTCPDRRASCVLHEEGVTLLMEGKHEAAAAKFAAAIAAEPTARSYLGYAQAVESLGQIALAYDTMVSAQRMSTAEVKASGGKDADLNARAERIKYKLGELRAKIGFIWLRVPEGVPAQRVVAVQRQGEGDLTQPLTQWTAVAPVKQVLVASLDDGSKVELVATVAAGTQGVVIIPIAPKVGIGGGGGGRIGIGMGGGVAPGGGQFLYQPRPPPPDFTTFFALGGSIISGGDLNTGTGLSAFYERKAISSLGLTTRLEYLVHGEDSTFTDIGGGMFRNQRQKGSEVIVLGGLRTLGNDTWHGRAGVGFSVLSFSSTDDMGFTNDFTRLYPAFELGGGLNLGRFRIQMGLMATVSSGADVNLGTRFMGTLAIDLYRAVDKKPAPPTGPPTGAPTGPDGPPITPTGEPAPTGAPAPATPVSP